MGLPESEEEVDSIASGYTGVSVLFHLVEIKGTLHGTLPQALAATSDYIQTHCLDDICEITIYEQRAPDGYPVVRVHIYERQASDAP